ncbi:MAG: hypothetical protein FWG19_04345 [Methanomassiliicoccaceae archaeon]|nr:hypothetical protein [Methanomassiliicoccaceae archaeon]
MEYRLRTPDAGAGTTYRLIFTNNPSTLILVDIYPKNKQEKVPLDLVNYFMANVAKDCTEPGPVFVELFGESCKDLIR